MSRLLYSNVTPAVQQYGVPQTVLPYQSAPLQTVTAPITTTQYVQAPQQTTQYVQAPQQTTQYVQAPQQTVQYVQAPQVVESVVQQVQAPQVVETVVQQVQAPVVQQVATQVIETVPQSQGPFQTGVRQEAAQLGESRFEYIPKERTWVEYEAQTKTEYVPKEVKLTDHYAVEHITEYVPQVYQDTYVDYHPQERFQERVEYQQRTKRICHPQVTSEITETILQTVAGPEQLIPSGSQVIETGNIETINHVEQPKQTIVQQPQVQVVQQVQQPVQQVQYVQQPVQQVQQVQYAQPSVQYVQQPVQQVQSVAPLVQSRVAPAYQTQVSSSYLQSPRNVIPTTAVPTTQFVGAPLCSGSRIVQNRVI